MGEAIGRQMAVVFFETKEPAGNLVQRTRRETQGMHHELMTIAMLLLALGIVLPADSGRTAAETEILLETKYAELDILRVTCAVEPEDPDVHVYQLEDQVDAEVAMVSAVPADQRTKMMLARALHRNDELLAGETLKHCWNKTLPDLQGRTGHLFPAAVPAAGPAVPAVGRGRGRGKGRGRGRGR